MNTPELLPAPAEVRAACGRVADPEFGVSIDDLGLIYGLVIAGGSVTVAMTLTSAHCPAGEMIVEGVRAAVAAVAGVTAVEVHVVWEPVWTPERISPHGREQLGWG